MIFFFSGIYKKLKLQTSFALAQPPAGQVGARVFVELSYF